VNTSLPEAEGLPNAFIQAWLNHTPVLSLNHDPNGWIEKQDLGYCAHGNVEDFLAKSKALLQDDIRRKKMAENSRRFAKKTFAADETIDAYLKVFKEIWSGGSEK
jgi:glycosyltransferase involved in cell wall biosynthesis